MEQSQTCTEPKDRLLDYHLNELKDEDRESVRQHLLVCERCATISDAIGAALARVLKKHQAEQGQ